MSGKTSWLLNLPSGSVVCFKGKLYRFLQNHCRIYKKILLSFKQAASCLPGLPEYICTYDICGFFRFLSSSYNNNRIRCLSKRQTSHQKELCYALYFSWFCICCWFLPSERNMKHFCGGLRDVYLLKDLSIICSDSNAVWQISALCKFDLNIYYTKVEFHTGRVLYSEDEARLSAELKLRSGSKYLWFGLRITQIVSAWISMPWKCEQFWWCFWTTELFVLGKLRK